MSDAAYWQSKCEELEQKLERLSNDWLLSSYCWENEEPLFDNNGKNVLTGEPYSLATMESIEQLALENASLSFFNAFKRYRNA